MGRPDLTEPNLTWSGWQANDSQASQGEVWAFAWKKLLHWSAYREPFQTPLYCSNMNTYRKITSMYTCNYSETWGTLSCTQNIKCGIQKFKPHITSRSCRVHFYVWPELRENASTNRYENKSFKQMLLKMYSFLGLSGSNV